MKKTALICAVILVACAGVAWAQDLSLPPINLPDIRLDPKPNSKFAPSLQLSFFLMSLSLIPYATVCCTSFIRTTIMLSYLKSALGSTQALSNQLMMGITLFMTMYIMAPVVVRINDTALQPYLAGSIEQDDFGVKLISPVKEFMLANTRRADLDLFTQLGGYHHRFKERMDAPFNVVVPSYIISEVKTGFFIGFLIYLPFLIVDMIVAATLMSMGMFMISPSSISLPFKLMLFVTIDGWHIVFTGLVNSFHRPPWMGTSGL